MVKTMKDDILNEMLEKTVAIIEEQKVQFFEIYNSINSEILSTQKQLTGLQSQTINSFNLINKLMKQLQVAKQNFAKVSADVNASENEIKSAYENVKNIQNSLDFEQSKWQELGKLGDKTEWRLKKLNTRLKQAEELSLVVGSMFHYLSSRIKSFVYAEYYLQPKEKSQKAQIIQTQEEERRRIARELHEDLELKLENILLQLKDSNIKNQVDDCLASVRKIKFNLRPLTLDNIPFSEAIKNLISSLDSRGILRVEFGLDGKEIVLPQFVENALFRIIQESLNNTAVHSGVKNAKVRLLYSPSSLSILISDEGKGFNPDEVLKNQDKVLKKINLQETPYYKSEDIQKSYYGIKNILDIAKIVGAEIKIISSKGSGTKIHCKMPYRNEDIAKSVETEKIEKALKRARKDN